jgi:hypothetical protein
MLKLSHETAWEGDDRDVMLGDFVAQVSTNPRTESRL